LQRNGRHPDRNVDDACSAAKAFSDRVRKYFEREHHRDIAPRAISAIDEAAQTDAKTLKASPLTKRQKDSLLGSQYRLPRRLEEPVLR
jgi:hypothetical protein